MSPFFHIDLSRALHDAWHHTAPEPVVAIGGGGFGAWLLGVNWAAVAAVVGIAVPLIGNCIVQVWKQYKIALLEIDAKRRELDGPPKIILPASAAASPPTA